MFKHTNLNDFIKLILSLGFEIVNIYDFKSANELTFNLQKNNKTCTIKLTRPYGGSESHMQKIYSYRFYGENSYEEGIKTLAELENVLKKEG